MDEQELKIALQHDRAGRGLVIAEGECLPVAGAYLESAAVAARAAAAGVACRPAALKEARKMAQVAIEHLERALVMMSLEAPFDV